VSTSTLLVDFSKGARVCS